MNENINEALDQISDAHIHEAAGYTRSRRAWWISGIAAALAVIIGWTVVWGDLGYFSAEPTPMPTIVGTAPAVIGTPDGIQSPNTLNLVNLVAAPEYPQMVACPNYIEYNSNREYYNAYAQWESSKLAQYDQPDGYADTLADFWARSIPEFLSGEGNRAYSPINVYLALAMLAETTGGNTRQEILDLLGADSIEALRTQASQVWNAHYSNDGQTTSLLANSLWLDQAYEFEDDTVQTLADSYYASVFHGDLGTGEMDQQLRAWLNAQTGGLLEEQTQNISLSPDCVFTLASTVYFTADWDGGFDENSTAEAVFHCEEYDLVTQFMNKTIVFGTYYWGEDFGAVYLPLSSGGMWLILPDEGKSVEDVLESGKYLEMTMNTARWENRKQITINLSMPKFDISDQTDLVEGLKDLGLRDVFDAAASDFSPMTDARDLSLGKIDHAVRVAADEEGVIAAAYTTMVLYGTAAPALPDDEIDFILDRPFLFVVSSQDSLPLFAGVVSQP